MPTFRGSKREQAYVRKAKRNRRLAGKIRRKISTRLPRQLIPATQMIKLKYAEQISLNPGIGSIAAYTFSANGCYDPNVTSTGHQPMGFDQYVGVLYDHYCVVKSKISCAVNTTGGTSATGNMLFGILLRDTTSSTPSIPDTLIEQGRCRYTNIAATGQNAKKLSYQHAPLRFLNHKKTDAEVRGDATANPLEQSYYILWASSTNGSDDASPLDVNVVIEYWVELSEPRTLGAS